MSITDGEAVERENVRLRWIVKDLHWLARRYCDGRMSYVTSLFNQHTRDLVEMGVRLEVTADADGTIWARDGMGRTLDHLTDEEAALGRPLEDWQRVPADQDEHLRLRADLATAQVRIRELEAERAAARFQMEGRMTPMPYEFADDDINDVYQVSGAAGGARGERITVDERFPREEHPAHACPQCGGIVRRDHSACWGWPQGDKWMRCLPCDTAIEWSCAGSDSGDVFDECGWRYQEPDNAAPDAVQHRPAWLDHVDTRGIMPFPVYRQEAPHP